MKAVAFAVPILASCGSITPHYYEVTGGYGESEFDRPVSDFDTQSIMVTLGWYGDRFFQDLGKSNAYWDRYSGPLAGLGDVPGRYEPSTSTEAEADLFRGLVPEAPKTKDEGIALAWWGLAVLLLAFAVYTVAMAKRAISQRRNDDT